MPFKFPLRTAAWFTLVGLLSPLSIAQQAGSSNSAGQSQTQAPAQGQPPSTTQQTPADKDNKDEDQGAQNPSTQGKVAGTSNDRLFYTLPNFTYVVKEFWPDIRHKLSRNKKDPAGAAGAKQ